MSQTAEAGRKGKGVRSDCWVGIELTDSGGLDLNIQSKVMGMYGESIHTLVKEVFVALGIANVRLEMVDVGALPMVIAARIEAAIKRADPGIKAEFLPDMRAHCNYLSQKERFRRSRLYLPGNQPQLFINAGLHRPDAIILDLEDSVSPLEKDTARFVVRNALRTIDFKGAERMVRINQLPMGLEDLNHLVPHNVHLLLIPKCENADQVIAIDKRVQEISSNCGRTEPVFLMPIIESAMGVINSYDIAKASPNVVALAMGLEDYTADIGTQRTKDGRESFWARCQVVNSARAAKVQPIDTVFSDVGDEEGLMASVLEAKALGFDGKGCIHPRQIKVVHKGFAPDKLELEAAEKIVKAYEEAEAKGLGVASLGSKMIDAPVVKRAQKTVQLAINMGLIQGVLPGQGNNPNPDERGNGQ